MADDDLKKKLVEQLTKALDQSGVDLSNVSIADVRLEGVQIDEVPPVSDEKAEALFHTLSEEIEHHVVTRDSHNLRVRILVEAACARPALTTVVHTDPPPGLLDMLQHTQHQTTHLCELCVSLLSVAHLYGFTASEFFVDSDQLYEVDACAYGGVMKDLMDFELKFEEEFDRERAQAVMATEVTLAVVALATTGLQPESARSMVDELFTLRFPAPRKH